jgi:sialate O-acetylesterase
MNKSIPLFTLAFTAFAHAELKLPAIIGDNMVLQQKQENPIWGWDTPGTEVTVTFGSQTKKAKADDKGKWTVKLDALPANATPATMSFKGTTSAEAKNVLVGEVWLCSGQSNMGFSVSSNWGADLEILASKNDQIRIISVPNVGTQELQDDFKGKWDVCGPETVGGFSAVGYFFGRQLQQTLQVPVGLIDNAWGGSAAEAWVKREVIDADPAYAEQKKKWEEKRDAAKAAGEDPPTAPRAPQNKLKGQGRPGNLYAGCLHPLIGYGIKGAIWYQGESNAGRAYQYNDLMTLMITEWRKDWKQGDFPFYFVQLADFMAEKAEPGDSAWAELREAQTKTMNTLKNTGQAVIIDLGEANDIHPKRKIEVAGRLARWALVKDYGISSIPHRSPEFKGVEIKDNKAVVTFDHIGGGAGLRTVDVNDLKGFAICGEDRKWVWADAKFVAGFPKNSIEVTSAKVAKPVAVRYAWSDNPVCNIVSQEGLPLTPFRTDDFPMVTQPK